MQNEKNCGARQVSILAEHVPRELCVAATQSQLLFHRRQQLLSTRVQDVCGDRVPAETRSIQANSVLLILATGLRQGSRLDEVLDRNDGVAPMHLRVVDYRHHRVETTLADVKDSPHVRFDILASQHMMRDRCCSRGDRRRLMSLFRQCITSWIRWKTLTPRLYRSAAKATPHETGACSRFC
jgi:hypothetical protein